MKTVIIGGVAGGASAAARLRRLDEKAEIVMLERGSYISFANCGLPYYIGGEIKDKGRLTIQTPESFKARFNVDVRIGSEVTAIDPNAKTVTVRSGESSYTESYDRLIISTGAAPVRPAIPGAESNRVFVLRSIPDTLGIDDFIRDNSPKTAMIIGGGYIGVEMAENLVKRGLEVTIAELSEQLIAPLDADMAADVHRYLRDKGIKLLLSCGVKAIAEKDGAAELTLSCGKQAADMVIMSVGVRPETRIAAKCGLELNRHGSIIVDSAMRTSVPDIYAVGDAVEVTHFVCGERTFIPLAGPANKQGRIAADNICGIESRYKGTQGSSVVKIFDMTVAATGLNEKSAVGCGVDYDKTYLYSASHATYYPHGTNMSIKVLWEKNTLRLLGAQLVGYDGVDKRADVLAAAIRFGARVTELAELELCYAPPYGSAKDPVNMAGFIAENVTKGLLKQYFWHDVAKLPRDGSVTLLDVRTKTEAARGMIDGYINIPLDNLRERIVELDKSKPVYVHCHSGLRSYIACRILSGYGFDCYNLAGGWRLYEAVTAEKCVPEYICTECK